MGKIASLMAGLPLLLAACGDDGSSELTADAAPMAVDAMDGADAAPQNLCEEIESNYPDLGAVTGQAIVTPVDEDMPDGPKKLSLQIPLNDETTPDVLFLELWQDSPPFDGTFAPIDITLNGDQGDLVLCGACSFIAANYQEGELIDFNMAYTGALSISAVDATVGTGSVVGSLTGIKFREVTIDEAGQVTVENGCRSELTGVSFDFSVAAPPSP